jgi:hypothetical protein
VEPTLLLPDLESAFQKSSDPISDLTPDVIGITYWYIFDIFFLTEQKRKVFFSKKQF